MRVFRWIVLTLAIVAGSQAQAGEIRFTHRQWNGLWWTDIWDVEFPNIWTPLGTIQGYYTSPW